MIRQIFIIGILLGLRLTSLCQTSDSRIIDKLPIIQSYKGGDDSLYSYLNTTKIPDRFYNDSTKGLIIFEITIDTLGKINGCRILRSLLPQIDSLFYYKILQMPQWTGGTNNFVCTLPLKFNNFIIDDNKVRDIIKDIYMTKK